MNRDEQVVFEHLKKIYGENVVFEPDGNKTPDFSLNSSTAIEVTRLNQHFFGNGAPEGLENLSFPLFAAFEDVLESLNYLYTEKSYWVFIDYKRPFNSNIRQAKKDMILALRKFLDTKVTCFPWDVSANPEITLSIYESNSGNSKLFSPGGNDDLDAGGWVIPIYVQNIRYCIDRKSSKISKCLNEYSEWWLYLIDNMRFLSDKEEISEIVNLVGNTGSFDKICLLSYDGKNILATFSKQ